jgi:Mg2+ and Co2+ transporter CorA
MLRVHRITAAGWEITENPEQLTARQDDEVLWLEIIDPDEAIWNKVKAAFADLSTDLWIGTGSDIPKLISDASRVSCVVHVPYSEIDIRYRRERGLMDRFVIIQDKRLFLTACKRTIALPYEYHRHRWRSETDREGKLDSLPVELAVALLGRAASFDGLLAVFRDRISALGLGAVDPTGATLRELRELTGLVGLVHWIVSAQGDVLSHLADRDQDGVWKELNATSERLAELKGLIRDLREELGDARDTCMALLNYRASEVMRVLAILTAILVPFTIVPGMFSMIVPFFGNDATTIDRNWLTGSIVGLVASPLIVLVVLRVWFKKRGWVQ